MSRSVGKGLPHEHEWLMHTALPESAAYRLGEDLVLLELPSKDELLPSCLTAAECDVVRGILLGATSKQLARARGVSAKTIANQLDSVFRKMGIGSRAELALVVRLGAETSELRELPIRFSSSACERCSK